MKDIMPTILAIQNLRVEFPTRDRRQPVKVAVKNLTLSVNAGEVFGFLGPNGAGKTTTMNVMLGFNSATSGDILLFGTSVRQPIARQRIGFLPEMTYYYKFLTGEELLRFYGRLFRIPKVEAERRIDAALKLGLAQALINNPDLLILDEPTSGLDPIGRMKVRQVIQRLKDEGKTVFFSSHEMGEVETICDRVAILHEGELRAEGRVKDLVAQHQCNLEQVFLRVIGFQN